jgi:hypothetical protein
VAELLIYPSRIYRSLVYLFLCLSFFTGTLQKVEAAPWVRPAHHDLDVTLSPENHSAKIADLVTLYPGGRKESTITFLLHANYKTVETVIPHSGNWHIEIAPAQNGNTSLQKITVHKPENQVWPDFFQITFHYNGTYTDALRESGEPPSGPPAEEEDHGIFLSGESYFYPVIDQPACRVESGQPGQARARNHGQRTPPHLLAVRRPDAGNLSDRRPVS